MRTRPSIPHMLVPALLATVLVTGVMQANVQGPARVALHATLAGSSKTRWGLGVSNTAVDPDALETAMGRVFASRGVYSQLGGQKYPSHAALAAQLDDAQIYLNINSWHLVNGVKVCYRLADVAAGTYDDLLATWVQELMDFGYKKTIIVFHHEPTANSRAEPHCGKAREYVQAYDHVYNYFRSHGITYPFVWNEVASAFNLGKAKAFQPPAADFQIVGVDGYNRFPRGIYRTPSDIFDAAHEYALALHKPLLIAEVGVVEDPHDPLAKAHWIMTAADLFRSWGRIVAVEWNDTPEFRPDSSATSLAAWVACSQWDFYLP